MAVDDSTGTTDPSYTNADGLNVLVQTITYSDANGLQTIRYQRQAALDRNRYSGFAFVSVANAGTEQRTTIGTFGDWTTVGAPATPDSQEFLNEIRTRTDIYTTSGITHNESRVCIAPDGCDGPFTRVEPQPNTFRNDVVTESRSDTTDNPNFVTGPTALITGDTSAIRPDTIQLTNSSTAGDNPITSVVWSDDSAFIDVSSTGLVTAFGAFNATVTLTVSDAFGNSDSDTHSVAFTNAVAPTIFVSPSSRSISAAGGAGVAFSVSTTGTNVTVTVAGENAGPLVSGLSASANGSWSWTENTGAARNGVIRFTVTDGLSQTDFQEVTVSQAQAVAMATCSTYTFTHGTGQAAAIGSYTLCDGTVVPNTTIPNGFSACIQDGTALAAGTGSWSQGAGCS